MLSESKSTEESVRDARDLKIEEQARTIAELTAQVKDLKEKLAKLESLLASRAEAKSSKAPVFRENYSLDRNEAGKKNPKKKSTGRKPADAKRHLVTDTINLFADGVDHAACIQHRSQFAWRIIDGKAACLRYDIYDLPDSTDLPLPPGLRNNRGEFGIEIILILAFLHYWVGVSIDNAIQIMNFFTGLDLPKSQADSLLSQLATDWNEQYDTIAELIALQTIVYIVIEELQAHIMSLCSRRDEAIVTVKAAAKAGPPIEPTNNRSERNVRREAEIRKGARTSKTAIGAKRRGTIVTVFASLQTRIANFTLTNTLAEIDRWTTAGVSLFQAELDAIKANLPPPTTSAAES